MKSNKVPCTLPQQEGGLSCTPITNTVVEHWISSTSSTWCLKFGRSLDDQSTYVLCSCRRHWNPNTVESCGRCVGHRALKVNVVSVPIDQELSSPLSPVLFSFLLNGYNKLIPLFFADIFVLLVSSSQGLKHALVKTVAKCEHLKHRGIGYYPENVTCSLLVVEGRHSLK